MSKTQVSDFDPDVCMGTRDDVDGPCPHRAGIGEDTGHGAVDRLARIEGAVMDATGIAADKDESDFKCGMCSCPLVNLGLTNMAPKGCPRLAQHNE